MAEAIEVAVAAEVVPAEVVLAVVVPGHRVGVLRRRNKGHALTVVVLGIIVKNVQVLNNKNTVDIVKTTLILKPTVGRKIKTQTTDNNNIITQVLIMIMLVGLVMGQMRNRTPSISL
jgi:hypothetical protein